MLISIPGSVYLSLSRRSPRAGESPCIVYVGKRSLSESSTGHCKSRESQSVPLIDIVCKSPCWKRWWKRQIIYMCAGPAVRMCRLLCFATTRMIRLPMCVGHIPSPIMSKFSCPNHPRLIPSLTHTRVYRNA